MTTKQTTPFTVVEEAMNAALATARDNQDKFAKAVEAEAGKAQKAALSSLDAAVTAHHANVDALVAATKAAIDGFAKIGELAQAQAATAIDGGTADLKTVLAAKDPKEAMAVQMEVAKAAQHKATEAAEALAAAGRDIASDVAKPIEAQITKNLKTLADLKVA